MVLDFRNPAHSREMQTLFPNISSNYEGVDLDNVEVKEARSNWFTVYQKDMVSEFILFYHHPKHHFYVIPTETIQPLMRSEKRGFRISQIKKLHIYETFCYKKIKEYVNNLREEYFNRNFQTI